MKAMNTRSSLSKRLKMRRKPLSPRDSRSTSLRRRHSTLLFPHGSTRVLLGGTTGMNPRSKASWRVSLPSYALSINRWQPTGNSCGPSSSARPSGVSPACPGASENPTAQLAQDFNHSAALPVVHTHPRRAIPDAKTSSDHFPGRVRIVKVLAWSWSVSNDCAICRIPEPPGIQLASDSVTKADQAVLAQLRWGSMSAVFLEVLRRCTANPRKRTELASGVTRKPGEVTAADCEVDPANAHNSRNQVRSASSAEAEVPSSSAFCVSAPDGRTATPRTRLLVSGNDEAARPTRILLSNTSDCRYRLGCMLSLKAVHLSVPHANGFFGSGQQDFRCFHGLRLNLLDEGAKVPVVGGKRAFEIVAGFVKCIG
jgi:hypothetical protein